jgi:Mn2+/Fe2+ NRAMP family transporter
MFSCWAVCARCSRSSWPIPATSCVEMADAVSLCIFGTVLFVKMPWTEAAKGLFVPTLSFDPAFWTMVVAILGTTISPYLFFWQAAQEVEDIPAVPQRKALLRAPAQAESAQSRIAIDYLRRDGVFQSRRPCDRHDHRCDAARPWHHRYGNVASGFALGIIGTGLLAVPVLAASASYALAEARKWPSGLSRRPLEAKAF